MLNKVKDKRSLLSAYYGVAATTTAVVFLLTNKYLILQVNPLSRLHWAIFCAFCQQLLCAIYTRSLPFELLKSNKPKIPLNHTLIAFLSITTGLSIVLNHLALASLPVGVCQLIKITSTPFLAAFNYLVYGEKLSQKASTSLVLLVFGVGLVTVKAVKETSAPLLIATAGLIFSIISQIITQRYNKHAEAPLNRLDMLRSVSPRIAAMMLVLFIGLEIVQPSEVLPTSFWTRVPTVTALVFSGVNVFAVNYYTYAVISGASSLTFQVFRNAKVVLLIIISITFEGYLPNSIQTVGIIFALCACMMYGYTRFTKRATEQGFIPLGSLDISEEGDEFNEKELSSNIRIFYLGFALFSLALTAGAVRYSNSTKYIQAEERAWKEIIHMIDPNDRDALIKNGCFVDPRTKANNWKDSTAPIMLDNECQVQVSKRCSIPNVYHGVWLGGRFKIHHAISFKSVYTRMRPFAFYIHGYDFPVGDAMWDHAVKTYNIILVPTRRIKKVFGSQIDVVEHKSDIIRLETVLRFGGVYADSDLWMLKDLSELLARHTTILDRETEDAITNSFIGAPRCSVFVKTWYSRYQTFNDSCWACHSVFLPHLLNLEIPGNLYVTADQPTPTYINSPTYNDSPKYLYGNGIWDFTNNWAVHTWWRMWGHEPTMSEWENGSFADGTAIPIGISRAARSILFNETLYL